MVNVFLVVFCALLACSACDEEITYTDIVSFIEDLYPDLMETKADILETNNTIRDVWHHEAVESSRNVDLLNKKVFQLYLEERLTAGVKFCIKYLVEKNGDPFDKNEDLLELCDYKKYFDVLEAHYTSLTSAEDSAQNIVSDFISANMWCSNNGDLPSCYSQVHRQIIEKGVQISSIIQMAKDAVAEVEDDYETVSEGCLIVILDRNRLLKILAEYIVDACVEYFEEN